MNYKRIDESISDRQKRGLRGESAFYRRTSANDIQRRVEFKDHHF